MKKKYVVIIAIIIIILIGIAAFFLYQRYVEEGRKYEIEKIDEPQFFIIKQEQGYGVINKEGDIILEPSYESVIIPNPEKPVFICYGEENSTQIFNNNKEQIFTEFENINPIKLKNIASDYMYEKSCLIYTKEGKLGLINLEGEKLTKPIYDEISAISYKEGELLVKQGEKYGVINLKGNNLVKTIYDEISVDNYYEENNNYLYAGYIVRTKTQEGYRYGYVNTKGKEVLPTEFTSVSRITDIKDSNNIYLMASKNGQYGVYKNGEQIIPNQYISIRYDLTNNILVVQKGNKYGVIGLNGENIIPIEYMQIDITGKTISAIKENNEVEIFDRTGKKLENSEHIAIIQTENEKYSIKIDSTNGTAYTIVDEQGNDVTKERYSYISHLYDNYFIVSISGGKLGVIDVSEKQKVEIKYDSIEKIEDTKMLKTTLTENNIIQIYSSDLELICEMSNCIIEYFDDYIKVYNNEDTKYFDFEGKEQSNIELFANNLLFAKQKDGKWGYVDKNGNVKVDYMYDKTTDINSYGYGAVKIDNKWGVIDRNGKVIIEPTYEFNNSNVEPEFLKDFYKVEFGFGEYYFTK